MKNICKTFKDLFNNCNIYAIEKHLMAFFGYWPVDKLIKWRIITFFTLDLFMNLIPSIKYLINTLTIQDSRSLALVVPQVLVNIHNCIALIIFIPRHKTMKAFIEKFQEAWISDKNEEWQEIQKKTAQHCNRVSICSNLCLHVTGLFYVFIPQSIFIVRHYFLADDSIEKTTILLLE